ncbi:Fe(3+)-hydroxamate ABC transporter permease FhuB [Vreelandella utahensis]|uniref:Fe(3+)-hydroxamate ABC transporter permease FhuB n=1 Tax=Vreelandella halophila TaxID=86177 RepID=UPI00117A6D8E|nr:Fe(3+)-hydroxamate ABC transporter permease FhuB [Halomonas utahensis]
MHAAASLLATAWPRYVLGLGVMLALVLGHLQLDGDLGLAEQWRLITGSQPSGFDQVRFYYTALPRALLAIMVGAVLGTVGSLLQQVTRNPLVSPLTVGASSGAWLALVGASVWLPALATDERALVAMVGAMLSVGLVLAIAGRNGIGGLPVILAGMATHLLMGAAASAIILLNQEAAQGVFIWGAGNLTQNDWNWVQWLWPRLLVLPLMLALAPRPLTLMRLGEAGARGRGFSYGPVLVMLLIGALWILASSITAVGIIGFLGLIAPNIARSMGARRAGDELAYSALLGAVLLLATDSLAQAAGDWFGELVPSGTAAAMVGAPALVIFAHRKLSHGDQTALALPQGARRTTWLTWTVAGSLLLGLVALTLTYTPGAMEPLSGFPFAWPSELIWSLRAPRLLTASAAGVGMAVAGLILQRLIRNPLASPDILGMSAGATLALVVFTVWTGTSIYHAGPGVAFLGSLVVLVVLLIVGRRSHYAPGIVILVGISLAALMEALVHFVLAQGTQSAHIILGWLSGSTYRASADRALMLAAGVAGLVMLVVVFNRWLTLISIGDPMARARGVNVARARLVLLLVVCALCALVTALMGPVAFVGLLAPHVAALLGARRVLPQLVLAAMVGMGLMTLSDWLGRTLLYPDQLPAGLMAALIGGSYFIFLLTRRRLG